MALPGRRRAKKVLVSIKQDLYDLGAPDTTGFPAVDTDEARLIVAAFGKDGPPVAAKRLTVKGRQFPVTVELTADDLAFPLTKVKRRGGEGGQFGCRCGSWVTLLLFLSFLLLLLLLLCRRRLVAS